MNNRSIAVLGLGRMGSAIAEALIVSGHQVTVWNRTAEKTFSFNGRARVATTIIEACDVNDVIMVCVLNYHTSDALLRVVDVELLLLGKTLVQLSRGHRSGRAKGRRGQRPLASIIWMGRCPQDPSRLVPKRAPSITPGRRRPLKPAATSSRS